MPRMILSLLRIKSFCPLVSVISRTLSSIVVTFYSFGLRDTPVSTLEGLIPFSFCVFISFLLPITVTYHWLPFSTLEHAPTTSSQYIWKSGENSYFSSKIDIHIASRKSESQQADIIVSKYKIELKFYPLKSFKHGHLTSTVVGSIADASTPTHLCGASSH